MSLSELFKYILRSFFVITTGIVLSMFLFCKIFEPDAVLLVDDTGRILLMAVASSLPYFIFYSPKELSKKQMFIRQVIHFVVLLSVLIFFASLWEWVNIYNFKECSVFILLVSSVYIFVNIFNNYQEKKLANKLNDSLKKRYHS